MHEAHLWLETIPAAHEAVHLLWAWWATRRRVVMWTRARYRRPEPARLREQDWDRKPDKTRTPGPGNVRVSRGPRAMWV